MIVARKNFAIAAMLDGRVPITGGLDAEGRVRASSEIYDPTAKTSVEGPQLNVSRANHDGHVPHRFGYPLQPGPEQRQGLGERDQHSSAVRRSGSRICRPRPGQPRTAPRQPERGGHGEGHHHSGWPEG
jgi:hypothetical protein